MKTCLDREDLLIKITGGLKMSQDQAIKINEYVRFAACLPELLDAGVFVSDRDKIVYYKPSKDFDLNMQIGLPVKPGMSSYQAMQERRRVIMRKDNSQSGKPFITAVIPLLDGNEVIGTLALVETVERQAFLDGVKPEREYQYTRLTGSCGLLLRIAGKMDSKCRKCGRWCHR